MPRKPVNIVYTAEQEKRLLEIQRALLNHPEGFKSLADWANRRGFSSRTAQNAVQRHVIFKKPVCPPRKQGTTNLKVLSQLEEDTGIKNLFTMQQRKPCITESKAEESQDKGDWVKAVEKWRYK